MAKRNANFNGGGVMPSADTDLFEGDIFDFDADKPPSPEVNLWLAVVARVWHDAWTASDAWIINSDRTCSPDLVRAEARRWLLLDFGDFKRDREEICCAAGLDPDVIHKAALRRRKLAVIDDQERRKVEIAAVDQAFRNMVEREADGTLTAPQITANLRHLAAREARL